MRKTYLKTGMLVETKAAGIYVVINNTLISKTGWMDLNSYTDGLKHPEDSDFDIQKVSMGLDGYYLSPSLWTCETLQENLLWERKLIEIIKINGLRYNKEEVLNNLKNLKPVN